MSWTEDRHRQPHFERAQIWRWLRRFRMDANDYRVKKSPEPEAPGEEE